MVDPITIVAASSALVFKIVEFAINPWFLVKHYGFAGLVLWIFGSGAIWRMEKQVLESEGEEVAMDFKRTVQNESNMIAVAGSILAQIAITALSLPNLSEAHWIARGFFTFSLVSAIIAVYYASDQYRILGRQLNSEDVRVWIRNDKRPQNHEKEAKESMPSVAAVLTISAPNMLLSASLNSFLLGLGIYLAYVWTRNLDTEAGKVGSLAIFFTYVASLTVCYGIYALSGMVVAGQGYIRQGERMRSGGGTNEVPPSPVRSDEEASQSHPAAARAHQSTGDTAGSRTSTARDELIEALRTAARLRRESAAVDERIAQLYERLSRR